MGCLDGYLHEGVELERVGVSDRQEPAERSSNGGAEAVFRPRALNFIRHVKALTSHSWPGFSVELGCQSVPAAGRLFVEVGVWRPTLAVASGAPPVALIASSRVAEHSLRLGDRVKRRARASGQEPLTAPAEERFAVGYAACFESSPSPLLLATATSMPVMYRSTRR